MVSFCELKWTALGLLIHSLSLLGSEGFQRSAKDWTQADTPSQIEEPGICA